MDPTAAFVIVVAIALLGLVVWWLQVWVPRRVAWRDVVHEGIPARVADGLVLQHDDGRTVWGSRGYAIYRSIDGMDFTRVARVRPPAGEAWGGYLKVLRRVFGYQELVEVLPLDDDRLVVFAAGHVHRIDVASRRSRRTHRLRYFGRGRGRGLMAFGVTRDLEGNLYYAEYVTESGDRPTGIWKSTDDGEHWLLAYEFQPEAIRHVHAIQCDPHDGALWIGTGDRDEHCFVGVSRDGAATFEWVGHGRQLHRTCAFAFFPDGVLWAMDADFEQNHVLWWDRAGRSIAPTGELPDATYYATRVDDERVLLGLAQGVAEAWIARRGADRAGSARRWIGWDVPPSPPRRGPSRGVRLARGDARAGRHLHLNPLRTTHHEAAIYRIARTELQAE